MTPSCFDVDGRCLAQKWTGVDRANIFRPDLILSGLAI